MGPEVLITVFVASLVGSLHCVGMCGGFVAMYSGADASVSRWGPHLVYNLGRMTTYLALGAIAGTLGSAINLGGRLAGFADVAALISGALLLTWGVFLLAKNMWGVWLTAPMWFNRWLGRWLPRLLRRPPVVRAGVLGMTSVLLPCPWLYGFVVTASSGGHALAGATVMLFFWLGTVPAMFGTGLGLKTLSGWLGPKLPVLMPTLLIALGLITIAQRGLMIAVINPDAEVAHCHGH